MRNTPEVLLLDDGELQAVAQLLDALDVPFTRRVGGQAGNDSAPPLDLVIATPDRAGSVRRGSPADAARNRPVRIIAASEDSSAMRRRMKRLGFQVLVRTPAHEGLWQALIEEVLPATSADSDESRAEMDSAVSVTTGRSAQRATLRDLANRGCRLYSHQEFRAGARVEFQLDGDCRATLSGRLVRVHGELDSSERAVHSAAMLFDNDLASASRAQISDLINSMSSGGFSYAQPRATPIPACAAATDAEFMLDDETDPPIRIDIPISLCLRPEAPIAKRQSDPLGAERRVHERGAFLKHIRAEAGGRSHVLMGSNISAGGMRIDHSPELSEGAIFRLAIYGPTEMDPITVNARVARNDGAAGMALSFENVSDAASEKLEKLVACLPQVQSLEDGESSEVGAVVSRILSEV